MASTSPHLRFNEAIVSTRPKGAAKQLYRWELVENGQPVEVDTHGGFVCNDSVLMVEAVLDGLGLAYTFDLTVAEHIK
jgi:DNA-binding transcriptional LysR family regulator